MSDGNDRPSISIGKLEVGGNSYISAGDMVINHNSSTEDVLKIIGAIQNEVTKLDIIKEDKKRDAERIMDEVKTELECKEPDKKKISERIRKALEILKEAGATTEALKEVGSLVGKVAIWLGTTTAALGLI